VYSGKFAGQAPCGQITGQSFPNGLYVDAATHDLYAASEGNGNVVVFHRGQITPYNTYTDPSREFVSDVTVAKDGTVIACNYQNAQYTQIGSISTWIAGPNGGTFVGTYPMTSGGFGWFVTVDKAGTVYFNSSNPTSGKVTLWSLSCPAGVCGAQTQVAGVSFTGPGGLGIDVTGDLVANDSGAEAADTFELPNPSPSTFYLSGYPFGMAINKLDRHWFTANLVSNDAAEYSYPSGKLVGTVPGNPGGRPFGIAVDP
jgi:hypothetical protein